MFQGRVFHITLFVLCIVSRCLSSIYYIEDIDSLRFALAAKDFNVAELQPHFPGYPVYVFLLQGLYLITGSIGFSCAVLGGFSIYLVIAASLGIWKLFFQSHSILLATLLFLNPLMWIMSTRYMPDIMGLALVILGAYMLIRTLRESEIKSTLTLCLIIGLLCGVRLSYVPFFLPALILLWKMPNQIIKMALVTVAAIAIWLIPMILDTGWDDLLTSAKRQTDGHFKEWGGGMTSNDASLFKRFELTFEGIWADGLGGWWGYRHWLTILLSIAWMAAFSSGCAYVIRKQRWKNLTAQLLLSSICLYMIWAFLFQNVMYKPRHIMPILPFLTMLALIGFMYLQHSYFRISVILISIWLPSATSVTLVLAWQHCIPSAISQSVQWLNKEDLSQIVIHTDALKRNYYSAHAKLKPAEYILEEDYVMMKQAIGEGKTLYSTNRVDSALNLAPAESKVFYHNPYVNRLWSRFWIHKYTTDEQ